MRQNKHPLHQTKKSERTKGVPGFVYWPATAWAVVILVFSLNAGVELPASSLPADKLGHFTAYALLSALVLIGLLKEGKVRQGQKLLAVVGAMAYGLAIELIQGAFFPHRQFEAGDILANCLGALAGLAIFTLFTFK